MAALANDAEAELSEDPHGVLMPHTVGALDHTSEAVLAENPNDIIRVIRAALSTGGRAKSKFLSVRPRDQ